MSIYAVCGDGSVLYEVTAAESVTFTRSLTFARRQFALVHPDFDPNPESNPNHDSNPNLVQKRRWCRSDAMQIDNSCKADPS